MYLGFHSGLPSRDQAPPPLVPPAAMVLPLIVTSSKSMPSLPSVSVPSFCQTSFPLFRSTRPTWVHCASLPFPSLNSTAVRPSSVVCGDAQQISPSRAIVHCAFAPSGEYPTILSISPFTKFLPVTHIPMTLVSLVTFGMLTLPSVFAWAAWEDDRPSFPSPP